MLSVFREAAAVLVRSSGEPREPQHPDTAQRPQHPAPALLWEGAPRLRAACPAESGDGRGGQSPGHLRPRAHLHPQAPASGGEVQGTALGKLKLSAKQNRSCHEGRYLLLSSVRPLFQNVSHPTPALTYLFTINIFCSCARACSSPEEASRLVTVE